MPLTQDEVKAAMKEAIKEWMNERYQQFGRWSFFTFMSALFAAFAYFIFWANGFHK